MGRDEPTLLDIRQMCLYMGRDEPTLLDMTDVPVYGKG